MFLGTLGAVVYLETLDPVSNEVSCILANPRGSLTNT